MLDLLHCETMGTEGECKQPSEAKALSTSGTVAGRTKPVAEC